MTIVHPASESVNPTHPTPANPTWQAALTHPTLRMLAGRYASRTLSAMDTQESLDQHIAWAVAVMDMPPYNTPAEKLAKAAALVRDGKVTPLEDGSWRVQGSRAYLVADLCECYQGRHGQSKWCKHLVAVEMLRRILLRQGALVSLRTVPQQKEEPMNTHTPEPPVPTPPTPVAAAEPFAPSTLCLKARVAGIEFSWTLRGDDDDVARRAQRVLAYVARLQSAHPDADQAGAPGAPQAAPQEQPNCRYHGTQKMTPSKYGEGRWVCSVKLESDGSYCNDVWPPRDRKRQ